MEKIYIKQIIEKKSVDENNFTIDAIFSTPDEDRHGDIVEQNWDLKAFKKNPVLINSHQYSDVTEVIGKVKKIKVEDGKLQGTVQFAVDENPKAKVAFDLYAGGFLNAFSAGFIPKEFDNKGKILKSELVELSGVSVPSNSRALAKQKGIDVDLYEKSNGENIKNKKNNEVDAETESESDEKGGEKNQTDGIEEPSRNEKNVYKKELEPEFANWFEGNEEIIYKERSLHEFEEGSLAKIVVKQTTPRVKANVGILKEDLDRQKIIQSYFFPREEGWNIEDSKKWMSTKDYSSLYLNKEMPKKTKNEIVRNAVKAEHNKKLKSLSKVNRAVKLVYEETVGDDSSDKKTNNRLINKAVNQLLKLKE